MKKKSVWALVLVAIAGLFSPVSLRAEEGGTNILFIFDASGSMYQTIEKKTKLKTAKEVLSALVGDLPAGTKTGLEAYGHRVLGSAAKTEESCRDIELIVPVQALDAKVFNEKLHALDAKGKTPIAASLKKSADVVRGLTGKKTIILISDGEETCGGDPVKVAEGIKKEFGADVEIHVIGFDVKEKEKQQLSGIAAAGGGTYYSADNAQQLKESLVQIKKVVVEKAPPKKKVVKKAPPKDIFVEEFDKPFLSEEWKVINEDPDNIVIEDGHLTVLLQPGWPSEGKTKNILLYAGDLPKNYEVAVKFKAEIVDYPHFRSWETQRVGLALYNSKKDFIEVNTSTGGVSTGDALIASYGKYKDKKWVSAFSSNLQKVATQEFKIQKIGRKYTAFFKNAKGKWISIGTVSSLKGKYKPGIVAYRAPNAKETMAEFDFFKIKELE